MPACILSDLMQAFWIGKCLLKTLPQGTRVAWREHPAGLSRHYQIIGASHPLRHDGGAAKIHGFIDHQSPGFALGRQHQHICRGIDGGQHALVLKREKEHAVKPKAFRVTANDLPQWSIAHENNL